MERGETTIGQDAAGARLMRGVHYIERNIEGPISLADIAGEAALSEFHFHRLFRSRYGISVMDYVRRRRLAKAADALVRTETSILEIALDAGFESQAAFTRAFRRVFHTTPANYRSRACDVPWLSVATLSEDVLATLPGLGNGEPRLEEIEAIPITGIEEVLTGERRLEIPRLWERLIGMLGPARFHSGPRFGVSDVLPDVLGGTFRYMAGVTEEAAGPLVGELVSRTVPGGRYAVFTFRGSPARLAPAIDYLFSAWMPCSDHELRIAPCFERYPKGFVPSDDCEFEIWIPVERA